MDRFDRYTYQRVEFTRLSVWKCQLNVLYRKEAVKKHLFRGKCPRGSAPVDIKKFFREPVPACNSGNIMFRNNPIAEKRKKAGIFFINFYSKDNFTAVSSGKGMQDLLLRIFPRKYIKTHGIVRRSNINIH